MLFQDADDEEQRDEENSCRYPQICQDISNFCIRNKQIRNENISYNSNDIPRPNEDSDIVKNCDNALLSEHPSSASITVGYEQDASLLNKAAAPSLTNGRFQVSKVQLNSNIPRYISGKVNGRFKVYKVKSGDGEATTEEGNIDENTNANNLQPEECVPRTEQSGHSETDGGASTNDRQNVNHSILESLPGSPNHQKRRVTIDSCTVPIVHKVIQDIKSRRKSTPSLGMNLSGVQRDNTPIRPSLRLKLSKQLEFLDLRSTVPLSPGRLVESCGMLNLSIGNFFLFFLS